MQIRCLICAISHEVLPANISPVVRVSDALAGCGMREGGQPESVAAPAIWAGGWEAENCGMAARTTSSGSLPSTAGLIASCARAGPVRNGRHLNIRPWPRRRAAKGATRSTLAADRSPNSSGDHVDPFGFRSCRVRVMVPCRCPFMPCCAHAVQGPPIGLRCARDVARAGWPWLELTRVR